MADREQARRANRVNEKRAIVKKNRIQDLENEVQYLKRLLDRRPLPPSPVKAEYNRPTNIKRALIRALFFSTGFSVGAFTAYALYANC